MSTSTTSLLGFLAALIMAGCDESSDRFATPDPPIPPDTDFSVTSLTQITSVGDVEQAAWSPTRDEMLVATPDELRMIDLRSRDVMWTHALDHADIHDVAWVSGGDEFIVLRESLAEGAPNRNLRMSRDGVVLGEFGERGDARVAPDLTDPAVLFTIWGQPGAEGTEYWLVRIAGGTRTQQDFIGAGSELDVALSPDGRTIVYGVGDDLRKRDVEAESHRRFAPSVTGIARFAWSRASRWMACETPRGLDIVPADSDWSRTAASEGRVPFWSPDGSVRGYVRHGDVWLAPFDPPACGEPEARVLWPRSGPPGRSSRWMVSASSRTAVTRLICSSGMFPQT